jgi:general secretion pathway protein J
MKRHPNGRAPLLASRRASQGFTLIEVLVALTLLGLMSIFLFGSFRFGVRAWEAGSKRIDELADVEVVQNLLRNELSEATPLVAQRPPSQAESTLAGSSSGLRFVAPLPAHRGIGGYYLFWLSASDSSGHGDLMLRWRVYRPDMVLEEAESDETTLLLHQVTDARFDYFGRVHDQAEPSWHESWNGQDGLPALIRLRMGFPSGDRRRWPDLVVATKLFGTGPQS